MKEHAEQMQPVAARVPLSTEESRREAHPAAEENAEPRATPSPSRVSDRAPASPGVQRAASILRSALPFVQRLLPLLDGQVATTVGNLLASRSRSPEAPSLGRLDLAPIEEGLAELRSRQHGLRLQLTEQNISLRGVEDRLEALREAADRNTLAQQKLHNELQVLGRWVKTVVVAALVLAAAGFFMALVLFLRMKKALP